MVNSSRLKSINKKFAEASHTLGELATYAQNAVSNLENQITKLEIHLDSVLGLNAPALRNAMCQNVDATTQHWCPKIFGTIGSGPWNEAEFDIFLRDHGFDPKEMPDKNISGLIVGASEFSESAILKQLVTYRSTKIKVYTQELFVVGLILNQDPYEVLEQETIDAIGCSHPAIELILENDIVWPIWPDFYADDQDDAEEPSIEVIEPINEGLFNEESPLKRMGYTVHEGKLGPLQRRDILSYIFHSNKLNGLQNDSDIRKWGSGGSGQRLYAMISFLLWLDRFQGPHKIKAREKWRSDIAWLKRQFYKRSMNFIWPE